MKEQGEGGANQGRGGEGHGRGGNFFRGYVRGWRVARHRTEATQRTHSPQCVRQGPQPGSPQAGGGGQGNRKGEVIGNNRSSSSSSLVASCSRKPKKYLVTYPVNDTSPATVGSSPSRSLASSIAESVTSVMSSAGEVPNPLQQCGTQLGRSANKQCGGQR